MLMFVGFGFSCGCAGWSVATGAYPLFVMFSVMAVLFGMAFWTGDEWI